MRRWAFFIKPEKKSIGKCWVKLPTLSYIQDKVEFSATTVSVEKLEHITEINHGTPISEVLRMEYCYHVHILPICLKRILINNKILIPAGKREAFFSASYLISGVIRNNLL